MLARKTVYWLNHLPRWSDTKNELENVYLWLVWDQWEKGNILKSNLYLISLKASYLPSACYGLVMKVCVSKVNVLKSRFKSETFLLIYTWWWMLGSGHCFEGYGSFRRWGLAEEVGYPLWRLNLLLVLACLFLCLSATLRTALPMHPLELLLHVSPPWWTDIESQLAFPPRFCQEFDHRGSNLWLSPRWALRNGTVTLTWAPRALSTVWWHKTMKRCLSAALKRENPPLLAPDFRLPTFGTVRRNKFPLLEPYRHGTFIAV